MKRYNIGFNATENEELELTKNSNERRDINVPRKSIVDIYFPSRHLKCTYYNDKFDLHEGDLVYVDGKLEGHRGKVVSVSYSFKIKLSDYKRVVSVVDTNVKGEFYFAASHMVTFDRTSLPYEKVISWLKLPEMKSDDEIVCGYDYDNSFYLDNLSGMNVSPQISERGGEYYMENRVVYISIDGVYGRAIVEGTKLYEVEFEYINGEIFNLTCPCYCSYTCKHEFAAMLQLKEILECIGENYSDKHTDYFAAIFKDTLIDTVMDSKKTGKISFD